MKHFFSIQAKLLLSLVFISRYFTKKQGKIKLDKVFLVNLSFKKLNNLTFNYFRFYCKYNIVY